MPLRVSGVCQATTGRLHRGIALEYSSPRGRWKRFSRIRPLHSESGIVPDEQGQGKTALQKNGWEPWSNINNWTRARANQVDDKNIVIGDLEATLDAHRTANRLHKIIAPERAPPSSKGFRRLDFLEQKDVDTEIEEGVGGFRFIRTQSPTVIHYKTNEGETRHKIKRPVVKAIHIGAEEGEVGFRENQPRGKKLAHVEEYEGQDCQPNASWQLKNFPDNRSPWTDHVERTAIPGIERLSMEIAAYERYMSLRAGEVETAEKIQEIIGLIIKEAIPAATVDLMGSYYDGLATPFSDMDFRLSLPMYEKDPLTRGPSPGRPKARKAMMKLLKELHDAFAASDVFDGVTLVNAAVPIIKLTHIRTKLMVDVQVSSRKTPQQLYRENYLTEYPTLRPLYILLRSALHIRGLGTVYQGGLGSYPILIMIVYVLKTCPLHIDKTDVGNQLLYLLKFYATANFNEEGYSLDPPSVFSKLRRRDARAHIAGRTDLVARGIRMIGAKSEKQPYLLCLQDPADPTNDLGRKSYSIKHVQKVFGKAYERITNHLHQIETSPTGSGGGDDCERILQQGLLFPLVGANYEDFEARRRKKSP